MEKVIVREVVEGTKVVKVKPEYNIRHKLVRDGIVVGVDLQYQGAKKVSLNTFSELVSAGLIKHPKFKENSCWSIEDLEEFSTHRFFDEDISELDFDECVRHLNRGILEIESRSIDTRFTPGGRVMVVCSKCGCRYRTSNIELTGRREFNPVDRLKTCKHPSSKLRLLNDNEFAEMLRDIEKEESQIIGGIAQRVFDITQDIIDKEDSRAISD